MTFEEFNLDDGVMKAISYMGFDTATPVQELVIPIIMKGSDLIACAQTGTGKTAAYVLPILDKLTEKKESSVDALIIVPTRELAVQIEQQIQGFSYFLSASSIAIYGGGDGVDWEQQKNAIKRGTDIIIATPGKLLSYLKMGDVKFDHLRHLVLDEADRMLDMGFVDDIRAIISYLPKNRQTLMFSATMPKSIRQLAQTILHNPEEISLAMSKPAEGVDQKAFLIHEDQKVPLLTQLLTERSDYESILVFTSMKSKVSEIVSNLNRHGFHAKGISSNLEQDKREEVLGKFKARRVRILVATDVLSRGIDVKEINLVVNFDVPYDAEDYVHRVGRTARINAKGEAITLVVRRDLGRFRKIEKLIESEVPKMSVPENLGPAPSWEEKESRSEHQHHPANKKRFHGRPGRGPRPGGGVSR